MSKKILLIESDAAFASELSAALEARGLEARVSGDGKEGLDLARVDRPDAIVLSVELPKMSGYSICNKLKKDDALKDIPLVIMSAEATAETFEQHRKLKTRAEDYLLKPFAPGELLKKIANLVALPAEVTEPIGAAADADLAALDAAAVEEVVTLDDVEELEASHALASATAAGGHGDDEDLKLLDEAFESLSAEEPSVTAPANGALHAVEVPEEALAATAEAAIDQLGDEADAALAALGADDAPEPTPAAARAEPPAEAIAFDLGEDPPRETEDRSTGAEPLRGGDAALSFADPSPELERLQDRVAELLIELARAKESLEEREAGLAAAQAHAAALEAEATEKDAARSAEAATAAERDARLRSVEEELASSRHAFTVSEEARRAAEAALEEAREQLASSEERVRSAEEVTRAAEARAAAAETETAELTLKLEEATAAAGARDAELHEAREAANAAGGELEAERVRAASLEAELSTLRGEAEAARAQVTDARAEADRSLVELKRRVAELEAQSAKHEERVVKAYQKIKGDEKIREKTRKALAIALQLLEERAPGAPPVEVQPRRE